MKKRTYLTTAQRNEVVAAYRGGASAPVLAKKYNVSTGSIYAWAKKAPKENGKKLPGPPKSAHRKRLERDGRRKKVDPIEVTVDNLLQGIRTQLVAGIRDLVALGVRVQLDNLLDAISKRVVSIT